MKTLENYKFETNINPGENLLGFIQGQIRQYIIPDGSYSQLLSITLYSERNISSIVLNSDMIVLNSDMTNIHFILTPKVSVPYQVLKAICKEIMEALNEEIFDGFLDAKTVGNMITYSAGPDNGSTMVGIINEELGFNICLM